MKTIRFFLSENFHFFVVKFSVYLNRLVFVVNYCTVRFGFSKLLKKIVVKYPPDKDYNER